jgi:hypothetical protein
MAIEKHERGLGDTLLNFNKKIGVAKIADTIAKLAGYEDCGCEARAEIINEWVPYKNKENKEDEEPNA